jgi:hypothetical protein
LPYSYELLSHRHTWYCPTVSAKVPTFVPLWRTHEVEAEWTFSTAPICKPKCRAWTISHVHWHSTTGTQITWTLQRSYGHWFSCAILTSYCTEQKI